MKNISKVFATIMIIIFILSVCSLDSENYIPYITTLISLSCIGFYGLYITKD